LFSAARTVSRELNQRLRLRARTKKSDFISRTIGVFSFFKETHRKGLIPGRFYRYELDWRV
jgi:hypothetical protein